MSAIATGLRVALLRNKMEVEVGIVAPNAARVRRDPTSSCSSPPPPHRLTAAAVGANFGAEEESSHGSAGRISAPRGGV